MSNYTITTTDIEDAALTFIAGGDDAAAWLDNYVHAQLTTWTLQYQASVAKVSAKNIGEAYLLATPEQQQAVLDALGITVSEAMQPDDATAAPWMVP